MTVKVTLRKKTITRGRQSLYLDFYPPIKNPNKDGFTRREFLGLYILSKPKTTTEKQSNKQKLYIAEQLCLKRENELNKPEIYTAFELDQKRKIEAGNKCFIKYCQGLASERKGSNKKSWKSALNYLVEFCNGSIKFNELNIDVLERYKRYLLNSNSVRSKKSKLSQNTAHSYFNKVKAALKSGFKDGYLAEDLSSKVNPIPKAETRREFLTQDELIRLYQTDCNNPLLKKAALFSALTGLRFSDIKALTWGKIRHIDNLGYMIFFDQLKTGSPEYHPISKEAYELLGEKRKEYDFVFEGLEYSAYQNKHLYQWIGAAGITKEITFHCFRHTYATLQLLGGTDIYTVSKMLGHKDVGTTQVYAKITNESKFKAAGKIKLRKS
ncbi:integrase [Nonlabens sp. YIK11]|uniref:tyrosine-type recombinase/integrase n=1 Tax=Nonlabens sp. YIK11 TaxID=1453349 RepID=UPI0006DC674B|nr:site-specific integrase [Nonlabens sp. YIK11]KQC33386.1 integrase [Nonlabens sp. YIK11]